MTRAAQLAVLLAILLLALFSLWPDPAASDQPVAASRIFEFVPLRDAGSLSGTLQPRRPGLVRTTSPSASAVPSVTPVHPDRPAPSVLASAGLREWGVRPEGVAPTTGISASDPARDARAGGAGAPTTPGRTPIPSARASRWRPPSGALTSRAGFTEPSAGIIRGIASWFASPIGVSAAGPALRAALGPCWRGTVVIVTGPAGAAVTELGDWMRRDRLIDLDDDLFSLVCGALSRGICNVTVRMEP